MKLRPLPESRAASEMLNGNGLTVTVIPVRAPSVVYACDTRELASNGRTVERKYLLLTGLRLQKAQRNFGSINFVDKPQIQEALPVCP